jgi:hypothetical protein
MLFTAHPTRLLGGDLITVGTVNLRPVWEDYIEDSMANRSSVVSLRAVQSPEPQQHLPAVLAALPGGGGRAQSTQTVLL